MHDESSEMMRKLVQHAGRYPEDAFYFVRDGLSFAAEKTHGKESPAYRRLQAFLLKRGIDWSDLIQAYDAGGLPPSVSEAIDEVGGCDQLDRHVTGRELCWALRDFALTRWGLLARTVLKSWNITETLDFGRIVFSFIECEMMQKQPSDTLADFEDVYAFADAFDEALPSPPPELQSEDSAT